MLTPEQNERLTRVGPGTPGGALLRRYWQPLCAAAELTPEKPRRRIRLLGEDLVVFRTGAGEYGCVAEHCAHRGVSLYHGFVEDDGIRCAYHGWKYAASGRCMEQPFEPKGSTLKERICQKAYPVERLAGMLFAYMGPQPAPLLPRWDVLVREDGRRLIQVSPVLDCNWLQIQENTVDSVHTYYLHAHTLAQLGIPGGEFFYRPIESYDWKPCEWGIDKVLVYGGDRPEVEIRPPLVFPNILRIPQGPKAECLHWRVPVDDTHTRMYVMVFDPTAERSRPGPDEDVPIEILPPVKREDGEYDMTGELGADSKGPSAAVAFYAQDAMAWETQGEVFDRAEEHLGATDRGIAMFRRLLAEQIDLVERGGEPMALVRDPARNEMISFDSTPQWLQENANV
ncbi:MAG TPA: Rieske 2Fe-2S domain-containing protein [Chloroflexota bacterium]|nr:Rieske 2Fe-2S domain-containing protein [Chloroflexota bacterium]